MANSTDVKIEPCVYITLAGTYAVIKTKYVEGNRTTIRRTFRTLREAQDFNRQFSSEKKNSMRYIRQLKRGGYGVVGAYFGLPYKQFATLGEAKTYRDKMLAGKTVAKIQQPENKLWSVWK